MSGARVRSRSSNEPWEFKITLTKDEVACKFLAIPEHIARRRKLFVEHLSGEDKCCLHLDQMVCVRLWSLDRSEFYAMNVKKAVWNPGALMLVPWKDRVDGNTNSGAKFFQDFNFDTPSKLGFYWENGHLNFKLLRVCATLSF